MTPALERLIWLGEARFKAVTLGGTQKHILKVPNDSFIIILHMIHFPYIPDEEDIPGNLHDRRVTQMNVFSPKSFNSFVFRNEIGIDTFEPGIMFFLRTGSPVSIPTYLMHEDDVSFSFSLGTDIVTTVAGVAPSESTAKIPPSDYGKEGLITPIGNIPVSLLRDMGGGLNAQLRPFGDLTTPTATNPYTYLQFPIVAGATAFENDSISGQKAYPIVQVQYVEIKGNPTKLRASN